MTVTKVTAHITTQHNAYQKLKQVLLPEKKCVVSEQECVAPVNLTPEKVQTMHDVPPPQCSFCNLDTPTKEPNREKM